MTGTILGTAVMADAARDLHDEAYARFPKTRYTSWLNDGQRQIANLRPDASSERHTWLLSATGVKHSLPTGYTRMIDPVRYMGTNGTTFGNSIEKADRRSMDRSHPDWATDTASAIVRNVMTDQRHPTVFEVYPPQPASSRGYIDALLAKPPLDVTVAGVGGETVNAAISLDDHYAPSLTIYLKYRFHDADSENPNSKETARAYWRMFLESIGIKTQVDVAVEDTNEPTAKEN